MKLLKIENSQGFFLNENNKYITMDKITKEDLLKLIDMTLNEEEFEYDPYDDQLIQHQAHQIIYKSILLKLQGLNERREEFIDESQRLYLKEYEKYQADSN